VTAPSALALVAELAPQGVWTHFATFCRIPRPSKGEAALRSHLQDWATRLGLAHEVDDVGNLLIRKPAQHRPGHTPGLVLQAHLDMVCQKRDGSTHDFQRDPITPRIDGDWLCAPDTTLGADNGIGAALMLALLADTQCPHPPLEALFTVDEEAGMGGAHGLRSDWLLGRRMLNLDTEAWGEFYLGCAGGLDVDIHAQVAREAAPSDHIAACVSLSGLRGGHSGVHIHEERGNAIKLLVRVLHDLSQRTPWRLSRLEGGSARNALPRQAQALITVPATDRDAFVAALGLWQELLRHELRGVDDQLTLTWLEQPGADLPECLTLPEQQRWLLALRASPHGVHRQSQRVSGVVETSNNLGIVAITPERAHVNFMVRSLLESGSRALAAEIQALWQLAGLSAQVSGAYPGWAPNPSSPLLTHCQTTFRQHFQSESSVQVIHAGLECGLIAAKYPDMDIVSFGPTIRGAHAPGEAVHIPAVAQCWALLQAIVATA
jgi:dipeptidase D